MKQLALDIGLSPDLSLEGFAGAANEALLHHLKHWLQEAPGLAAPTYLWGPGGIGKTHLLRAVRAALVSGGASVGWLDSECVFPTAFSDGWAAVFLDDVHLYDTRLQHMAFNWLINASSPADGRARAVLAAGRVPPADLPLRADLTSRLAWGQVFEIRLPTDEDRRIALRRASAARGLAVSEELVNYLLTHFARDLGSQMRLLERLDQYALRHQHAATIPLLKSMLTEEQGSQSGVDSRADATC